MGHAGHEASPAGNHLRDEGESVLPTGNPWTDESIDHVVWSVVRPFPDDEGFHPARLICGLL